jgi:hypothetical protein
MFSAALYAPFCTYRTCTADGQYWQFQRQPVSRPAFAASAPTCASPFSPFPGVLSHLYNAPYTLVSLSLTSDYCTCPRRSFRPSLPSLHIQDSCRQPITITCPRHSVPYNHLSQEACITAPFRLHSCPAVLPRHRALHMSSSLLATIPSMDMQDSFSTRSLIHMSARAGLAIGFHGNQIYCTRLQSVASLLPYPCTTHSVLPRTVLGHRLLYLSSSLLATVTSFMTTRDTSHASSDNSTPLHTT